MATTLDLWDSDITMEKMRHLSDAMSELADAYTRRVTKPDDVLKQMDAIATEWTVHYDFAMSAGGLFDYNDPRNAP